MATPGNPQLAQAIKSYLAYCQKARRLSDHTCSAYKTDLAAFQTIANTEPADCTTIATALEKIIENSEHKAGTIARRVVAIQHSQ
jgi:site-specific recombinase XerD